MTEASSLQSTAIDWSEHIMSKTNVSQERIAEFCERRGIVELYVFGSVLRDDFCSESDIDILFQFEPDGSYNIHDLLAMEQELEEMFDRKVDFVNKKMIENSNNNLRRDLIFRTMEIVYDGRRWISIMTEIDRILLLDILNAARSAQKSVDKLDYEEFRNNREKRQSVVLDIQQIGERSRNVSKKCRAHFNDIHWANMINIKRRIVQDHCKINLKVVGQIATYEIPMLTKSLMELLHEELQNE